MFHTVLCTCGDQIILSRLGLWETRNHDPSEAVAISDTCV